MHGMQLGFESTLPYMKRKRKMKKKKKMLPVYFSVCFGMKSWSISGRCGGEGWVTMGSSCHRETCADEHSLSREAALRLEGTQGASCLWRAVSARASGMALKQLTPFSPWFIRQVLNLCIIREIKSTNYSVWEYPTILLSILPCETEVFIFLQHGLLLKRPIPLLL